jgi:hypothetical protein
LHNPDQIRKSSCAMDDMPLGRSLQQLTPASLVHCTRTLSQAGIAETVHARQERSGHHAERLICLCGSAVARAVAANAQRRAVLGTHARSVELDAAPEDDD